MWWPPPLVVMVAIDRRDRVAITDPFPFLSFPVPFPQERRRAQERWLDQELEVAQLNAHHLMVIGKTNAIIIVLPPRPCLCLCRSVLSICLPACLPACLPVSLPVELVASVRFPVFCALCFALLFWSLRGSFLHTVLRGRSITPCFFCSRHVYFQSSQAP